MRKDQIDELKLRLSKHQEIRQEWSDLQQLWINEFIQLLRNRNSPDYEKEMTIYLNAFDSLGSERLEQKLNKMKTWLLILLVLFLNQVMIAK